MGPETVTAELDKAEGGRLAHGTIGLGLGDGDTEGGGFEARYALAFEQNDEQEGEQELTLNHCGGWGRGRRGILTR